MSDTFNHECDAYESLGYWVDWGDREPEYYTKYEGGFTPDRLYYHNKYKVERVCAETDKALLLKLRHLEEPRWIAKSIIQGFKGKGSCYIHKIFDPFEED